MKVRPIGPAAPERRDEIWNMKADWLQTGHGIIIPQTIINLSFKTSMDIFCQQNVWFCLWVDSSQSKFNEKHILISIFVGESRGVRGGEKPGKVMTREITSS